jgi:general secretion pathway protein G
MLVTLAIVALLTTIALPLGELTVQRSREQELHNALREIRGAIDAYKQAWDDGRIPTTLGKSGYPPTLQTLVDGVDDPHDPDKHKIYFLRRLPRDPFAIDPTLAAADTWGKRSYASSADDPQEGEDVYDVYTKAPGLDLRGIPYRDW